MARMWTRWLGLGAVALTTMPAAAAPQVFWAPNPVRPDKTVLVQGHELAGVSVEVSRLNDGPEEAKG